MEDLKNIIAQRNFLDKYFIEFGAIPTQISFFCEIEKLSKIIN